jgi:hypothetical protein
LKKLGGIEIFHTCFRGKITSQHVSLLWSQPDLYADFETHGSFLQIHLALTSGRPLLGPSL